MHPLLVYLLAVIRLMAYVVLKAKTSGRPGCDMYSAQLVFVSHGPRRLTQLPILLFPLVFQECEAWLPLSSKNASGWVL